MLVEEMDDLLSYGVERLEVMLKSNTDTKKAFQTMTGVIEEISKEIEEENKGPIVGFFRASLLSSTLQCTSL